MGWRGMGAGRTHTKRKLYLRKSSFLLWKHVEDVKRDQKVVPDLLESIMSLKPSGLVKEELWMMTKYSNKCRFSPLRGWLP